MSITVADISISEDPDKTVKCLVKAIGMPFSSYGYTYAPCKTLCGIEFDWDYFDPDDTNQSSLSDVTCPDCCKIIAEKGIDKTI